MDNEISRLILALVLTGFVLFVWNYYRTDFTGKNPESVTAAHNKEKADTMKTDIRKNLSNYYNCGRLKIVVYPLYKSLEFINGKINNPGLSLVLLTLIIRSLITPLTIKQVKNSRNMGEIKDEIEKIKVMYKDNPADMHRASAILMKEKGINPFGDIVPFLIQVPLFFALYKIVREARIFSGAPLGFWIKDLGAQIHKLYCPVLPVS